MPSAKQKEAAAQIMEHFAAHDASHGYAQDARYGTSGYCSVDTAIGTVKVKHGDRDCTSGVADALESAGISCGGASWTGNYYDCMAGTGNFRFHRTSDGSNCDDGYIAQRGDVYLAHNDYWQHAAMCTSAVPDMLAEFSINSFGGISGDSVGDQTGNECLVREWYGGHWDYVIEVLADGGSYDPPAPAATSHAGSAKAPASPKYRVFRDGKWRAWKTDGQTAGTRESDVYDVDFEGLGPEGWFQLTLEGGEVLPRNEHNGAHKKKVIGITVYYDTPDPGSTGYYEALYRVFTSAGEWLKWEHDDGDDGAGDDRHAVRRFQLKLGKCE